MREHFMLASKHFWWFCGFNVDLALLMFLAARTCKHLKTGNVFAPITPQPPTDPPEFLNDNIHDS